MTNFIHQNKEKIGLFSAVVLSLIILIRWWYYIYTYSVNILFWNQWELFEILSNNDNLWEIFCWQIGPHRQGIGFIVTKYIASLSGWNTRVEAFVIGGIICLAMIMGLLLRARLSKRLNFADVAIALIFLTPAQYQIYAGAANMSHGPMPLLLLMLYAYAWVAMRGTWRYVVVLILNFLLIYSGFGIFAGVITPFLFTAEFRRAYRTHNKKYMGLTLTCLVISILSFISFFAGYHFKASVDGFRFPIAEWWLYPQYMSLMLANFCGIKGLTPVSYIAGYFIIFFMIVLASYHWIGSFRPQSASEESPVNAVIAVLITFTLIFCVNTAIGRVFLGMMSAQQSSRYITYMIPGFFGIYLWLVSMPAGKLRKNLLIAAVVCLTAATFPMRESDSEALKLSYQGKSDWKTIYLVTEDIETATRESDFRIYPAPEDIHLKQKLEYFKKNKLNLYLDANTQPENKKM